MVVQLEFILKKIKKVKVENSVKKMLDEETKFGIKKFKTYQEFGNKVYEIRENVRKNIKKLKDKNNLIIGYGAPAKATKALIFLVFQKKLILLLRTTN